MSKATHKKKVKKVLKKKSLKKVKKVVSKKRAKKVKSVKKSPRKVKRVVRKKVVKKKVSRKSQPKVVKKTAKQRNTKNEEQLIALIARGQEKGFVTDLEILEYFPTIEEDTDFLEKIYEELEQNSLKVIEVEALLGEGAGEITEKELKEATSIKGALPDNVQMYLREIGKTP